mmetsp:Transcript_31947/g.40981  ORF Transcript_31947/g.40981 Transcript_31947/m.40981 type:complete len:293 (+) Transcript_31947:52-930(+)
MDTSTLKFFQAIVSREVEYSEIWGDCEHKNKNKIPISWKINISKWFVQVAAGYGLSRHSVSTAIAYLNHYQRTMAGDNKLEFQLAAITSIYLASKLYDTERLTMAKALRLCEDQYLASHIQTMELKLLECLRWKLRPPTPYDFLSVFQHFLADHTVDQVEVLIDECHHGEGYSSLNPSSIAVAAILLILRRYCCCAQQPCSCLQGFLSNLQKIGFSVTDQSLKAFAFVVEQCPSSLEKPSSQEGRESPSSVAFFSSAYGEENPPETSPEDHGAVPLKANYVKKRKFEAKKAT